MDLGARIAGRIDDIEPSVSRAAFAARVGMKPDALSRAINGKRGFSSSELVRIASALNADIHELLTGERSSNERVSVSARHHYNPDTAWRTVPTFPSDRVVLDDLVTAYKLADLPSKAHKVRGASPQHVSNLLGPAFIRDFAARIQDRLDIDVFCLSELGTAYSGEAAGRAFIAIPASGSWFRENWDLAHELGHLTNGDDEAKANAFAAELLLPAIMVRSIDWAHVSAEAVADLLWERGTSTRALMVRLQTLRMPTHNVDALLCQKTQAFLRSARNWSSDFGDQITERMSDASRRRFPLALQEAHELGVEAGRISPAFLAWMRGVEVQRIAETYAPAHEEPSLDQLVTAFGFSSD